MKLALITGITGTLGQEVSRILLRDTAFKLIGYSRDEMKQMALKAHPRLTLYLGDVRDRDRLIEASRNCQLIYHFASLKCVDKLEENPDEAKKTIVDGTDNVLHAQRLNGVPRVVLSSTDKAVYPINSYGKCKALAEDLVLRNKNNVVVRYGNVIASRGSVIPQFVKSIMESNSVLLTHKDMSRFFLTPEEAANFVIDSSFEKSGGLKIPDIKATRITNIVSALATILGKKPNSVIVGIRPGEKIHEDLKTEDEGDGQRLTSASGPQFTEKELILKLRPIVDSLL